MAVVYDDTGVWFYGDITELSKFDFSFNQELKLRLFENENDMTEFLRSFKNWEG